MTDTLTSPHAVMARLEELQNDLATRENVLESAARRWFIAKRDKEREWATAYMATAGPQHTRKAAADLAVAAVGVNEEAEYEAVKAVCRVMETRAAIGMALLKAHGRS